jgi:threonine/homoserine/homoserine lactone efflux protein
MALGMISDGVFALLAGAAGDFLRRNRRFVRLQRWIAGSSFIGLGVTAAMVTRRV